MSFFAQSVRPLLVGISFIVFATTACGEKLPTKITIKPEKPLVSSRYGVVGERLTASGVDAKGRPFIKMPKLTFTSSDPTVATVDESGQVKATGSGKATLTVAVTDAPDVKATTEINVQIVGGLQLDPKAPKIIKFRQNVKMPITITDDKGKDITKDVEGKVTYEATGPCVSVSVDGIIFGQAIGSCAVLASVESQSVRYNIEVE